MTRQPAPITLATAVASSDDDAKAALAQAQRFRAVVAAAESKLGADHPDIETVWAPPTVVGTIEGEGAAIHSGDLVDARFLLDEPIGRGGHGAVWAASDTRNEGRRVAVKILHPHVTSDRKTVERLAREATVLSQLEHPCIARALGFGVTMDHIYMAMELVDGTPLNDWLATRAAAETAPSIDWVVAIVAGIGDALSYAHGAGITHRDIKPQNVMLVSGGQGTSAKVLDFGVAVVEGGDAFDATTQGRRVGSPLYMAPEQIEGGDIGPGADQFALACLVFDMLTLRRAWATDPTATGHASWAAPIPKVPANTLLAVLERIERGPRPAPSSVRHDLDPVVDHVLARAFSRQGRDRYPSIAAFVDAVVGAIRPDVPPPIAEHPDVTATPEGADADPGASQAGATAPRPPSRATPLSKVALVVALAVALVVVVILLLGRR